MHIPVSYVPPCCFMALKRAWCAFGGLTARLGLPYRRGSSTGSSRKLLSEEGEAETATLSSTSLRHAKPLLGNMLTRAEFVNVGAGRPRAVLITRVQIVRMRKMISLIKERLAAYKPSSIRAGSNARASVLIPILGEDGEARILLTKRSTTSRTKRGDLSPAACTRTQTGIRSGLRYANAGKR